MSENETKYLEVELTKKVKINHDCYIFSFKFVNEKMIFGIGQHFRIIQFLKTHQHPQGEELVRKYTPINPCSQTETIDFLVKIYRPNQHPQFPQGGKFTPFLEARQPGDKLLIQGPFGHFDYKHGGQVLLHGQPYKFKRFFFIAAGSGITPIFQTLRQLATAKQPVKLILLFANKTDQDIVLRQQLQSFPDQIKVHYILDNPPQGWNHYKGYITQQVLKDICPLDDPQTLYLHCGPFPFNKLIREIFGSKYPQSIIHKF